MKTIMHCCMICMFMLYSVSSPAQVRYPDYSEAQIGNQVPNKISNQYMPVVGVWVWGQREMLPEGYKKQLELAGSNSPFNLIIPFLRFPDQEVVSPEVHGQVKLAAEYAVQHNMVLAADLDVRAARRAFMKKYPDELQQMLRIREEAIGEEDSTDVKIPSLDLNDHYSGGNIAHHIPLSGSFLRAYAYQNTGDGIEKSSVQDISGKCRILLESKDSVLIRVPTSDDGMGGKTHICVMVSFTHLYPDIFAPHLVEFQQDIIRQYADVKLAGVCKDEWGFPPYYPRFFRSGFIDYWYSPHRAKAYAERTNGRELLADCLLMALGFKGYDAERQMVVNHFMDMSRVRNTGLEEDFYHTVKEVFGPDAAVTVHSTWWPYPDRCEFKKNGLDWWTTKRDWAQTDEVAPYAVRTALCKKWGSAFWYNMYYKADLAEQVWSSVLGGGRIDYLSFQTLYKPEIMQAENRIRLLNYISESPLDCPVAVIFGHVGAMNWAGPHYNDVGMDLADMLWHTGYPTDLIPTSEIENGSLTIDEEGYIVYGKQRYAAVVLYQPEFSGKPVADFFSKAGKGKTALFRIGEWTMDFNANSFDAVAQLPESMIDPVTFSTAVAQVLETLKVHNVARQTPATGVIDNKYFSLRDFNHESFAPPTTGFCRLIDGTYIRVAGTKNVGGDPIKSDFDIGNKKVKVDALGVFAVRFDEQGRLNALVAGGLKYFKAGDFQISLEKRNDMALWVDQNGLWQGVFQGSDPVPDCLMKITPNWTRLEAPVPPSADEIQKMFQ